MNTVARRCLCNGLLATAGPPQRRAGGCVGPAIVTTSADFSGVRQLLARVAPRRTFTTADVVDYTCSADELHSG